MLSHALWVSTSHYIDNVLSSWMANICCIEGNNDNCCSSHSHHTCVLRAFILFRVEHRLEIEITPIYNRHLFKLRHIDCNSSVVACTDISNVFLLRKETSFYNPFSLSCNQGTAIVDTHWTVSLAELSGTTLEKLTIG